MAGLEEPLMCLMEEKLAAEEKFNDGIHKTIKWCICMMGLNVIAKIVVTMVAFTRITDISASSLLGVFFLGPTTETGAQGGLFNTLNEVGMASALLAVRSALKSLLVADEAAAQAPQAGAEVGCLKRSLTKGQVDGFLKFGESLQNAFQDASHFRGGCIECRHGDVEVCQGVANCSAAWQMLAARRVPLSPRQTSTLVLDVHLSWFCYPKLQDRRSSRASDPKVRMHLFSPSEVIPSKVMQHFRMSSNS